MSRRTSALLIDDDARLGTLMSEYLGKNEIDVALAGDGSRGLAVLHKNRPDIVLLDIMLPGMDGLEVCRRIRALPDGSALPVIMLTAKGEDVDKVVGLEVGADDYLAKPFNPRELLARIRALLRRATPARAAGRGLSREQILDALKGHAEAFDRSIDVHIAKIRAKLEPDPKEPRFIKTVRGVGYLLARTPDLHGPALRAHLPPLPGCAPGGGRRLQRGLRLDGPRGLRARILGTHLPPHCLPGGRGVPRSTRPRPPGPADPRRAGARPHRARHPGPRARLRRQRPPRLHTRAARPGAHWSAHGAAGSRVVRGHARAGSEVGRRHRYPGELGASPLAPARSHPPRDDPHGAPRAVRLPRCHPRPAHLASRRTAHGGGAAARRGRPHGARAYADEPPLVRTTRLECGRAGGSDAGLQ